MPTTPRTTPSAPTGRVLLLLPTTTYRAHDFIEAGRRLGLETVVGSEEPATLEAYSGGRTMTLPLRDPEGAAAAIADHAHRYPLVAIVATDEATAEIAALASERLGLAHNPPEAARAARYKDRLRMVLAASGVPQPEFMIVRTGGDPERIGRDLRYPVVLKPVHLAASRGVIRADDPAGFSQAYHRIEAILARPDVREQGADAAGRILVEAFVPGVEVAVEAILAGGQLTILALFDKPDPLDGPFFEETIYVTPSRLPAAVQARIAETAAAAAAAIGLVEGPVHAELRVDGDRVTVLEVAARSIGGLCSRTLRFGTGRSLEELILMRAAGRDVGALVREEQAAGVMMLPIPRSGVLRRVEGLEAAGSVPGIESVTITQAAGRPVTALPEGSSYLGFLFARGADSASVEAALRSAHARLRVTIGDAP